MITFERRYSWTTREWDVKCADKTYFLEHMVGPKYNMGAIEYRLYLTDEDVYYRIMAYDDDIAFEKATKIIRKKEYLRAMKLLAAISETWEVTDKKIRKVV